VILTCVGTGTAAPEPDRVCSGYVLETTGLRLLLDCGAGVVHGMARLGVDWRGITHLVVTHFHNDHIGDVPMLFFAWKHGMRPGRSEPLTVIGPAGTRQLFDRLADAFGGHLRDPDFEFVIDEVEPGAVRRLNDGVRLRAAKTPHTAESLAYRIEADGRAFCYTGDTGMSEDVAAFAQAVDALLIECSVPDEQAMAIHLSPSQVAAMARIALPGRLLLTHVYPQLDRGNLHELVRRGGWLAGVEVPTDGARIEL
jgi:ribonuclease BN (tRNA processing enzyme)